MQIAELKDKSIRVLKYVRQVDVPTRAASVSYFAMLASVPLLAVILTLSAQLLPDMGSANAVGLGDMTTKELNSALGRLLPLDASDLIKQEITRLQSQPPVGLLSLGLFLSLWTASNAYVALMVAMNEIYGVEETRSFWRIRSSALLMPILFAVILAVALASIVAAPWLIHALELDHFAGSLMTLAQWGCLYFILVMSFEVAYRVGPSASVKSKKISPGSIMGATIFLFASLLFQLYVQQFGSYDKVYGSLGGAVIFLVWIWLMSACLLVGCAVNKVLHDDSEKRVRDRAKDFANTFG